MPLKPGKANFKSNVAEMVKAGHPVKQALAASYREAGEKLGKPKGRPRSKPLTAGRV